MAIAENGAIIFVLKISKLEMVSLSKFLASVPLRFLFE